MNFEMYSAFHSDNYIKTHLKTYLICLYQIREINTNISVVACRFVLKCSTIYKTPPRDEVTIFAIHIVELLLTVNQYIYVCVCVLKLSKKSLYSSDLWKWRKTFRWLNASASRHLGAPFAILNTRCLFFYLRLMSQGTRKV